MNFFSSDFLSSILKNPPWDFVVLFLLLTGGFFWGITDGKKKMAVAMLGIYVLSSIFSYVPLDALTKGRSPDEVWFFKAGAFLILLVFITLFLVRSFKYASFRNEGAWWEIILMSVLGAGFLAVSLLALAPPEVFGKNIVTISPLIKTLFLTPSISQWWMILPIFGVMFF